VAFPANVEVIDALQVPLSPAPMRPVAVVDRDPARRRRARTVRKPLWPADEALVTTSSRPVPSRPVDRSSVRPGFSPEFFDRLWDIHDIAAFIDASDATAWRAMNR